MTDTPVNTTPCLTCSLDGTVRCFDTQIAAPVGHTYECFEKNTGDITTLTAHVKETLKGAVSEGIDTAKVVGSLWGVESVKVHIAERARNQSFLSPEHYAEVCAIALRDVLSGMA